MKHKKWIISWVGVATICYTALYFFEKNDRFLPIEIKSKHPYEPAFESRPLSFLEQQELDRALSQKYSYLACGGQAFVFLSQDGKYVLKFFKQRHFRQPTYLNYIPCTPRYRALKFSKRKKRLLQEYSSYKIGFHELAQQTALVYLHLNATHHFKKSITLVDRLKFEHRVDLDTTHFILQKRAYLVPETLEAQMQTQDVEGAKRTICSVIDLIIHRCKLGYGDKDPNIATNCGIFEGRAIKIDVGRFYREENMKNPLFYKPELYHLTRPFRKWLQQNYPQLVPHLDTQVQKVIFHG